MNRKGIVVILLFILFVSFIALNIDFNANEEIVNTNEEYYYGEESLYYESDDIAYSNEYQIVEVLNETNKYRQQLNIQPLVLDNDLSLVANIRAMELAQTNKLSHKRPNGTYYSELFVKFEIDSSFSGENIAQGYTSAKEVCAAWSKSKGHYANMVKNKYNKLGVGFYTYNGVTYWVQIFSD